MNELKILLANYLKTHNLTRNIFIQKLGYKNTTKGLRRLDAFIEHPKNNAFKVQLCKQLDISIESMDGIINKHRDLIIKEKIKNFTPRIWIKWKKEDPLQLMMDDRGLNDIYEIKVPESLLNLPIKQQLQEVFHLYKQHQLDFYADKFDFKNYTELLSITDPILKEGLYNVWSVNDGFIYHKAFNESYEFNRLGEQINGVNDSNVPEAALNKQSSHMPKEAKVRGFVPYIQITWLKGPSLLMSAKQLEHLYKIEIPNYLSKPTFEQVCDLYKQHQLKHFAKTLNVPDTLENYPQFLEAIETKIKDGIYISWALGNGFTYYKSSKKHYSCDRHCQLIYDNGQKRVNTGNSDISV
ncbi:MAG: hypothetical protein WBM99_14035 [Psychromonas sp.]